MSATSKVTAEHLRREAYLYIRQSSIRQVQENRESTARQYDLKRRAQVLGWASDQIVVIDEDLGLPGTSAAGRNGFQRLVAEVGLGRVGVVMGLEVSRLARSSTDWHRLLEICALADTLILDEDGIYDPGYFNDRLLLGLKGTMSEAELHVLRARLIGGQLNKARRGELWIHPPIGYICDARNCLVMDPDQQIQSAVRLLFETFRRTGSAQRVVREFSEQKILFPCRLPDAKRTGDAIFKELEHTRVLQILHNPRYAGAYVYGRRRQRKMPSGRIKYRQLPREEWKVFIPNAHAAYIPWEEFEANQAKLQENAQAYGPERCQSPPREGVALLQGLVLCGICGRRMGVRYHTRQGHPAPDYLCQRRGIQTAQPVCQIIPGTGLDEAIAQIVLEAVTPAALEIALEVFEELRERKVEVDRLRRAQVERIREEAELARRQYMLVRPENRLVADNLERNWNEKLRELAQAEEEYASFVRSDSPDLTPEAKARVQALASDLPRVWQDPRTSARDRKRLLRLLIEDVTLVRQNTTLQIHIRWKGGATESLERPLPRSAPDLFRTPTEIIEQIRVLSGSQTDGQIAQTLNARCLRSGRGNPFTRERVRSIREDYDIPSFREHLRARGWLTAVEIAAQLGAHEDTAKRYAWGGVLRALRVNDRDEILFEPITGPLPKPHPGKRLKDRGRYPKCLPKKRNEVQYEA